jgi:K+ potassium transporter
VIFAIPLNYSCLNLKRAGRITQCSNPFRRPSFGFEPAFCLCQLLRVLKISSPSRGAALCAPAAWPSLSSVSRPLVRFPLLRLRTHHDAPHSGIIYSDIGTSPLYVLNGIWSTSGPVPPKEDVIGAISAIVWSLTLLPLCKYVCFNFPPLSTESQHNTPNLGFYLFALWYTGRFDLCVHGRFKKILMCYPLLGEGGTFALFQGIYPPKFFESTPTHDSLMVGRKRHKDIKPPMVFRWPMLIWVCSFPPAPVFFLCSGGG